MNNDNNNNNYYNNNKNNNNNNNLYLPREKGGRGLRAVETEYKVTKVKAALRLYENKDQVMEMVREFEERPESLGHRSLVKDAAKFAEASTYTLNTQILYVL